MSEAPRRFRRWIVGGLLSVAAVTALYVVSVLHFAYSRGDRVGYIQRFARRGWLCKTWEGELAVVSMPGVVPEKFLFSTRDPQVAAQVNAALGKRVRLSYEHHPGVPTTCFGETEFFVGEVQPIE